MRTSSYLMTSGPVASDLLYRLYLTLLLVSGFSSTDLYGRINCVMVHVSKIPECSIGYGAFCKPVSSFQSLQHTEIRMSYNLDNKYC